MKALFVFLLLFLVFFGLGLLVIFAGGAQWGTTACGQYVFLDLFFSAALAFFGALLFGD